MKRDAYNDLCRWAADPERRPLVIRGARQVGKTWLVESFAREHIGAVATLNLERHRAAATAFADPAPAASLRAIETLLNTRIAPGRCVLFLDEIQAAPEVVGLLRYFREELPALHVVAAGSLLDFALAQPTFSVPVGRISYLHIEPMSFSEFLVGLGEEPAADFLRTFRIGETVPEAVHQRLSSLVREYAIVGGMPAVVERYRNTRSWAAASQVQHDLVATLRDDFHKYGTRAAMPRLRRVFDAVPHQVGRKFKFTAIDAADRAAPLRHALDLLCMARVCHRVRCTHGHGLPLSAEVSEKTFKVVLLDTGLLLAALGLGPAAVQQAADLMLANEGAVAEHLAGQMLRTLDPPFIEPALFYWQRERRGAEAEVDYVLQQGGRVVPLEVKAGKAGRLRSLHMFVHGRELDLAVRVGSEPPQIREVVTALPRVPPRRFRLLSLPFYLAGELPRLIAAVG